MRFAVFFIMLLAFASCDADRVYEKNFQFDSRTWYVDSIPAFEFHIPADSEKYNISMNIRNTLTYPFQNIYITYFLEDTTGQVLETDLVNYQLFDARSGEPYGEGGLGDIYDHRFSLLEDYHFTEAGAYRIRLQQYMRRDSLPEIIAVGIRVDQNKNNN